MLKVVQSGLGPVRDVVIVYHLADALFSALKVAAPGACIAVQTEAPGSGYRLRPAGPVDPLDDAIAYLRRMTGGTWAPGRVILAGFSEGCSAVRAQLLGGADPDAIVVADGTHASLPPRESTEIDPWRDYANRARQGERIFIASHSLNTYVEQLKAPHTPYSSTVSVLRRVCGFPLDLAGPLDDPVRSDAGQLIVYSYASKSCDAGAHIAQGKVVLPRLLLEAMNILGAPAQASAESAQKDCPQSLGERAVAWALSQVGTSEEPPGSNTGPMIRRWLEPCERRDTGKRLGITSGNWCAAFACASMMAALRPGEELPHGYRASGVELQADAMANGSWRPVAMVLSGQWTPSPGDLAIWDRSTPGDPSTSWQRHVNRVVEFRGDASFQTVGGNESNSVRVAEHSLPNEPRLLGFIAYPQSDPDYAHTPYSPFHHRQPIDSRTGQRRLLLPST